jgi:lipopolysaccharide export system permease protein
MRLLDRYLLRELLIPLSYCFGGFVIFWTAVFLSNEMQEFQTRKLHGKDVLEYCLVTLPENFWIVLPVSFLLALLYALTNHARHHELTAMRAAGVSIWRLALPYFGVGFLFSGALFLINELWVPKSIQRAEQILNRYDKPVAGRDWQRDLYFRNEAEQRTWHAGFYNFKTLTLSNLNVQWHLPDGSWQDIYADKGAWTGVGWHFETVQELNYKSASDALPKKILVPAADFPFAESPQLFKSEQKIDSLSPAQAAKRPQLSIKEISEYFRLHPNVSAKKTALLKTQWHGRIAAPWTCLVVVLIALPFGAPSGRRNVFVGVAASIFIFFAYFILLRVGLTLGISGSLPPWLAAWLPNFLFAGAGIFLTLRVR